MKHRQALATVQAHHLPLWAWGGFLFFVATMLSIDLGVFNRKAKEMTLGKALGWCAVWITLALGFNGLVSWKLGGQAGLEFFTGYLIEICLSIDNIFVFILVFQYFRIPPALQHGVLFWGIIGAVIMRAVFIFAGITLLEHFHWIMYGFGAFLVFTGFKMAFSGDKKMDPEKNLAVRMFRKIFPVTSELHGKHFLVRQDGKLFATPLLIVLVIVETTDLVFALDSIPAVLAVTQKAFIVFTSNIFAILGLRALYFAISGVMKLFRYLGIGLAAVLIFIGIKMLSDDFYPIPITASLGVIAGIIAIAVVASLMNPKKDAQA
ncbi:MAG TPA: TerC family protein [Opitutaceae bacterium]|nr:TerC family protein [Opitutaceae bacterium]